MRKIVDKFWISVAAMLLTITVLVISAYNVQAASAKSQAIKAYNKFLSQKTIPWGNNLYYTAVPADTLTVVRLAFR